MITIFFVGDGPRDAASLPPMVSRILGVEVDGPSRSWKDLRQNSPGRKGAHGLNSGISRYDRKLQLAIRIAIDAGVAGLVAVVDLDKDDPGQRLRVLRDGRDLDRARAGHRLPVALGEANPHGEAWLLDDAEAVRSVLQLDRAHPIPTVVRASSPKEQINALIAVSKMHREDSRIVLALIAAEVDRDRCSCADRTGFAEFVREVESELSPLVEE